MPVIPKITDVFVTIDITHPQSTVGLKNPAIFVSGTTESYKEYTNLDAVEADFDSTSSVYANAEAIFAQDPAPELVAVITYTGDAPAPADVNAAPTGDGAAVTAKPVVINEPGDDVPTGGIAKAAYDYFYRNWEFAILADYNKDDAVALANLIETGGYDAKGYHLCFLQLDADSATDADAFKDFKRTWVFYHTNADEKYVAALAAAGAQPTIGQVSWKFVSNLAGITPEDMPASDILNLENQGLILYVHKGNSDNQTDDKNAAGMYIDIVHGMDQVKTRVETNLQNTLNTAGKTAYSTIGLGTIAASLNSSLNACYNDGIIASDVNTGKPLFTTSVPAMSSISNVDVVNRVLKNTTFGYTPSSAVNTIYVNGSMNELV